MEVVAESVKVAVGARLAPFVSSIAGYRHLGQEPCVHRGLPSPTATLILTLGEPLLIGAGDWADGPDVEVEAFDALIGGLHTTPESVVSRGRQAGVQLDLTPLGVRALLGVPMGALGTANHPALSVAGPGLRAVHERLNEARDWPGRFSVLEAWLLDATRDRSGDGGAVERAYTRIVASGGVRPVGAVAHEVGWSPRQLRTRVSAEIGFGPKTLARLARFDRARRAVAAAAAGGSGRTLAEVAATCGYADQAHLAREFRQLAGSPPSAWVRDERPFVQAAEVAAG